MGALDLHYESASAQHGQAKLNVEEYAKGSFISGGNYKTEKIDGSNPVDYEKFEKGIMQYGLYAHYVALNKRFLNSSITAMDAEYVELEGGRISSIAQNVVMPHVSLLCYLFESTNDVSVLPCGHTIHVKCLKEMEEHCQFACPLCSKSVCDMSKAWERLDMELATLSDSCPHIMQRLWGNIRGAVPFDRAQVPELQVIQHPSDLKKVIRSFCFLREERWLHLPYAADLQR
ncbi:hypothetical protein BAE44_0006358 [Dichanthelium oligosanthes]|uniref:RING-type domain-containing protein n=1 Tax=Dichanthelium oligosanthes TaxID=888268 RepID=A0A1E5W5G9_9POAL|nr:hypothetical protein BAE44_0006358 [Dichanthelium oligosanthes]